MSIPTAMKTEELLAILLAAYPEKQWSLQPYSIGQHERYAIIFSYNGTAIHDPLVTECSRFEQKSRFGLSEEHARMLRRHNRPYIWVVIGGDRDIEVVFERIVFDQSRKPDIPAMDYLDELGFTNHDTGGHCKSYALFGQSGEHIVVTDGDGSGYPETLGEAYISLFDTAGNEVRMIEPDQAMLFRAYFKSEEFLLEAYGQSRERAIARLKQALQHHFTQYGLGVCRYGEDNFICYPVYGGVVYRGLQQMDVDVPATLLPLYQRSFPDFGPLDVDLPNGFDDASWRNDAMPSWVHELDNGNYLRLWIDYAEPAKRDHPSGKRFAVSLATHDMGTVGSGDLLYTDDYAEVLQFVSNYRGEVTPYQCLRNAFLMSTEQQIEAWSNAYGENRPVDVSSINLHDLTINTAATMFAKAGGTEQAWEEFDADNALANISRADTFRAIHNRRYRLRTESAATSVGISHFAAGTMFADKDRMRIARLAVGETADIGASLTQTIVTRIV